MKKRLAKAVREGRKRRGWTQDTLAAFAAVSRDSVKRVEGGRHDPRISVVLKILTTLNLDGTIGTVLFGTKE